MREFLAPIINRDPVRMGKHPGWIDHRGLVGIALYIPLIASGPFYFVPRGLAEDRPNLVVVGGLLGALALLWTNGLCVGVLRNRFPRGLPEPRSTTLDGEPATFIPRWRPLLLMEWPLMLFVGLGCLAFAAVAAYDGPVLLAVALVPVGLWSLTLPLWVATGRCVAGGVWLTPTRVVQRWGSSWFSVAWDDLVGVSVIEPTVGIRATTARTRHLAPTFRNHQGVPRKRLGPDGSWILVLDLRFSAVAASRLGTVLRAYAADPRRRAEAGHSACADRLRDPSAHTVL